MQKQFYTVQDLAAILGVSKFTVYQWIYCGDLQTVQIKPKSAHRIPASEVARVTTITPAPEAPHAP